MIKPLTKIDVTRYAPYGPQVTSLLNNGFRPHQEGDRMFMIKETSSMRQRIYQFFRGRQTDEEWQETCEVFLACFAGAAILACFFILSGL